jgi:hypothetical protein
MGPLRKVGRGAYPTLFANKWLKSSSTLDFSHLNQSRWCRSRPSAQRGRPSAGTYDVPLSPFGDGARKRPDWANPSLLAQSAGSDSRSLGPPSCHVLLLLLGRTTEEANSACEGIGDFCVSDTYTDPRKVPRASKESEHMRFAVRLND